MMPDVAHFGLYGLTLKGHDGMGLQDTGAYKWFHLIIGRT